MNHTAIVLFSGLLLAAVPALAQDATTVSTPTAADAGVRAGVGAGYSPSGSGFVVFPVQVSPRLFVEPELSARVDSGDGQSFSQVGARAAVRVSLTDIWMANRKNGAVPYVGGRLGVSHDGSNTNFGGIDTKTSRLDLLGGAMLGGEFFFSKTFSIGGEVQVNYTMVGATEVSAAGSSTTTDTSGSDLETDALMAVRWYFL